MEWEILGQVLWCGCRNGMVYVLFALGLTLIFGIMGVVNFAHGGMYMWGAMLVYALATVFGINFFLSVALSVALVGVLGLAANRLTVQPLLRIRGGGISIMLSTMALSFMLLHGAVVAWGSDVVPVTYPFPGVLHIAGVSISQVGLVLVIVGAAVIGGLHLFLAKARLGKEMRATSQNISGAKLVAINVLRVYDYTMIVGAALAGLGGILLAGVLSTHATMGETMLVLGFAIVILGGMGNVPGVVVTGMIIGIAEALFGQYVGHSYKLAFIYALMIAGLLWRPQGVFTRR